jgi:hypothetical protein
MLLSLKLGIKHLRKIFKNKEDEIVSLAKSYGFEEICNCEFLREVQGTLIGDDVILESRYVPICTARVLRRYSPEEETIVIFHGMDRILYRGRNIFIAPQIKLRRICEGPEREGIFQCPYGVEMPEKFFELGDLEFQLLYPSNVIYAIKRC